MAKIGTSYTFILIKMKQVKADIITHNEYVTTLSSLFAIKMCLLESRQLTTLNNQSIQDALINLINLVSRIMK